MTKIRKQKRRKRYRYNVNRKRMNKKRVPNSQSKIIKAAWEDKITFEQNLKRMGLVCDVNKELKITADPKENNSEGQDSNKPKTKIVQELEAEAGFLRKSEYRLPKNQVEYLCYLLDKYGEDYKSMARDKKNVIQATWRQIRSKINTFKNIPEQYNEYLRRKAEG